MKITEAKLREIIKNTLLSETGPQFGSALMWKFGKDLYNKYFTPGKECVIPEEEFKFQNFKMPPVTKFVYKPSEEDQSEKEIIKFGFEPSNHFMNNIRFELMLRYPFGTNNNSNPKLQDIEELEIKKIEDKIKSNLNKLYEIFNFYFNDYKFQENFHCFYGKNFNFKFFKKYCDTKLREIIFGPRSVAYEGAVYISLKEEVSADLFHEIAGHILDDIFLSDRKLRRSHYDASSIDEKKASPILLKTLKDLTGKDSLAKSHKHSHDHVIASAFEKYGIKKESIINFIGKLKNKNKNSLLFFNRLIRSNIDKEKRKNIEDMADRDLANLVLSDLRHLTNKDHMFNTMRMLYIHIRYHENNAKTFKDSIRNEKGKLSKKFIKEMIEVKLPLSFYTKPDSSFEQFMRSIFIFSNLEKLEDNAKFIQNYEDRIVKNKSKLDDKTVTV